LLAFERGSGRCFDVLVELGFFAGLIFLGWRSIGLLCGLRLSFFSILPGRLR
jgi:hypothetical protein